jgi:chromosomal replication initiator protein
MDFPDLNVLWVRTKKDLENEMSDISFNTWIDSMQILSLKNDTLILSALNDFHRSFAEQYIPLIRNALKSSTGTEFSVRITVPGQETPPEFTPQEDPTDLTLNGSSVRNRLNAIYNFSSFVVGAGNRFAHAACVAIAEKQGGRNFNPLFLYGGSGLGKTHLMHAIGNYVKEHDPSKKVIYVQSENFVNEFIYTIKENKYDDFRNKYRNADILLIDDIQFIEGKEQMQIEFFHTFNSLYDNGKHIIMTCDKPPQSLAKLEERLRTRFSCGLTVDIQPPDYETRVVILKKRAQLNNSKVPEDVLDYIATNIASNIRELEGAFNTVLCYSLLAGGINLDIAREALKDLITPTASRKISCESIMEIVSNYYNISVEDLKSKRRSNEVAIPRQMAMYLCRNMIDMTFPQIGSDFGNRDHTTVMHACSKIADELKKEHPVTTRDLTELKIRMKG